MFAAWLVSEGVSVVESKFLSVDVDGSYAVDEGVALSENTP